MKNSTKKSIEEIFQEHYAGCFEYILNHTNCSHQDAQDCVMDAFVILHEKIMNNEFEFLNTRAYLIQVSKNVWRNKLRKAKRMLYFDPQNLEELIDIHNAAAQGIDKGKQRLVNSILKSIHKLKGKCKHLLSRHLLDGCSLQFLAIEMGYKNKNVVKTSKSRCMEKLYKYIEEIMTFHEA